MASYRIYPSVLNKFQSLLDVDIELDSPFNKDSEGEYKLSADELTEKLERELLDTINRVPHEPSEAADAGTCLNEVIDRLVLNTKDGREDVKIRSSRDFTNASGETFDIPCIYAEMDGFRFAFNIDLCRELRDRLSDCAPQYRCSAILPTRYGDVELYGDIDYIGPDEVIDLKTTSKYDFGKFSHNWQKELYHYCLVASGDVPKVSAFTYLVCQWIKRVAEPWNANIYLETYTQTFDKVEQSLRSIVEHFIDWLEGHRNLITDKKIFGE